MGPVTLAWAGFTCLLTKVPFLTSSAVPPLSPLVLPCLRLSCPLPLRLLLSLARCPGAPDPVPTRGPYPSLQFWSSSDTFDVHLAATFGYSPVLVTLRKVMECLQHQRQPPCYPWLFHFRMQSQRVQFHKIPANALIRDTSIESLHRDGLTV